MDDCLFCKIAAGKIDSAIVYDSPDVIAFEDINPVAPTHVLVIPRRHIPSASDLTVADGPLLAQIFAAAARIARDRGLDSGHRVVTNIGADAGQSVAHLHFHVLGGRTMDWPPG